MFDPQKPYNKLPKLPPDFNFDDVEILKKVNLANIALSQLNGRSLSIPNRALLVEPLSVREAVASSGIENINTTVAEVFQASLFPEREITKAQKETLHYRDALRAGYAIIKQKGFIHTNGFFAIQQILEPDKAGVRKLHGTSIVNSTTKEILYTPPEGEQLIRDLLSNYESYLNDTTSSIDPLIRMAVLHYQFEAIHPFYDGNGRTGRILMVLYLILTTRLDLPILFISGYINNHRGQYYDLLRAVTANNQWKPWIMFILDAVETQAIETSQTVLKIKKLQEEYKERLKTDVKKIYSAELIEYLFANPFYTQSTLAEKLNIHLNTAAKYLNTLLESDFLKSLKHKKEKIYFNPRFLKLLE